MSSNARASIWSSRFREADVQGAEAALVVAATPTSRRVPPPEAGPEPKRVQALL